MGSLHYFRDNSWINYYISQSNPILRLKTRDMHFFLCRRLRENCRYRFCIIFTENKVKRILWNFILWKPIKKRCGIVTSPDTNKSINYCTKNSKHSGRISILTVNLFIKVTNGSVKKSKNPSLYSNNRSQYRTPKTP